MQRPDRAAVRFVRALLPAHEARRDGLKFRVAGERRASLAAEVVAALQSEGVLAGDATCCRAGAGARSWLRRQLADADAFAAQHRTAVRTVDGAVLNLEESPLLRLSRPTAGEAAAFLLAHQIEAGERVRRLADKAQLQPRLTMSYDPTRTAGRSGLGTVAEIDDMASEARRALGELARVLPGDCAGVVLDVCGLHKGLQLVEAERGWPRRSAKLVLRIGLDQLASHWGLRTEAIGPVSRRDRKWLGEGARPTRFG